MSEIFQRAISYAKETIELDGRLPPILMAYTADSVIVIPMARLMGEERKMISDLLPAFFMAHGVTSYVMMHESWMNKEPVQGGKSQRLEVIMVIEVSREGTAANVHQIKREGLEIKLSPLDLGKGSMEGKLMSLLPAENAEFPDVCFEIAESIINSMGSRKLPLRYA